jgi:hypothetical protein
MAFLKDVQMQLCSIFLSSTPAILCFYVFVTLFKLGEYSAKVLSARSFRAYL